MTPNNSSPLLQFHDVRKSYGAVEVLKGINLSVHQHEVVSIIGASGSGKTTLLRCVNLLEEFQAGHIELDGETIGYRYHGDRRYRLRDHELARQRSMTGMVFQNFNLFPHLTAAGNVMLGLRKVRRLTREQAYATAQQWLTRVGLGSRTGHYPSQLSGGQQQRVAIARALAMNPKLVLLDEITSALDPELVQEVLLTVRELADTGATLLIVTHEMRFAFEVSKRIVFMDQGQVVEEGPPSALFDKPQSARLAAFLRGARL